MLTSCLTTCWAVMPPACSSASGAGWKGGGCGQDWPLAAVWEFLSCPALRGKGATYRPPSTVHHGARLPLVLQVPPAEARVHPPSHQGAAAQLPPAPHPLPRRHRRCRGASGAGGGARGCLSLLLLELLTCWLAAWQQSTVCLSCKGAGWLTRVPLRLPPHHCPCCICLAAFCAGDTGCDWQRVHPDLRLEQPGVRPLPGDLQEVRCQQLSEPAAALCGSNAVPLLQRVPCSGWIAAPAHPSPALLCPVKRTLTLRPTRPAPSLLLPAATSTSLPR